MITLRLLGGFEAVWNGTPVALASRSAQTLLAYLALNADRAHRREKLAGLLWPHDAEAAARANLRQVLWRTRKVLPTVIVADELTLAFNTAQPHWVDVFLLTAPATTLETQRAACDAYRGELLSGFYDDWIAPERERLAALADQLAHAYLTALCVQALWPEVISQAERWLSLTPDAEHAYRALMRAHAARGQPVSVREVYHRCEQALARELNAAPSPETTALRDQLLAAPPQAPLPAPLTTFVGRERELTQLHTLFSERRLITLTGAGGTGKTRLALEAAVRAQHQRLFPDGVWWVELAAHTDPAAVAQSVAQALSVTETSARPLLRALTDALSPAHALLILDNGEHLVQACAELTAHLVRACARLVLLVTTREALNIPGELILRVPSLGVPDPLWSETNPDDLLRYDAVRLFCDRAQATGNFAPTPSNLLAVAEICRRLDGIPLALELAAAQTAWLAPAAIAERLAEMFTLLSDGNRAALPRHRTLHAALEWSYALLPPAERVLLAQLSIFAGGWTLESAEAVCGAPGPLRLRALVNKSLVSPEAHSERYRLLEPIRQFAREKLDDAAGLSAAHAHHFAALAQAIEARVQSAAPEECAPWFNRLDAERDNLRTALAWAIANGHDPEAQFAATLGRLWFARASLADGNPRLRARTLYASGLLMAAQGEATQARRLFEQSVEHARRANNEEGVQLAQNELGRLSQEFPL